MKTFFKKSLRKTLKRDKKREKLIFSRLGMLFNKENFRKSVMKKLKTVMTTKKAI